MESVLELVTRGIATPSFRAPIHRSSTFPVELLATSFDDPLSDTVALVQRDTAVLSPATREFAWLAQQALTRSGTPTAHRSSDPLRTRTFSARSGSR